MADNRSYYQMLHDTVGGWIDYLNQRAQQGQIEAIRSAGIRPVDPNSREARQPHRNFQTAQNLVNQTFQRTAVPSVIQHGIVDPATGIYSLATHPVSSYNGVASLARGAYHHVRPVPSNQQTSQDRADEAAFNAAVAPIVNATTVADANGNRTFSPQQTFDSTANTLVNDPGQLLTGLSGAADISRLGLRGAGLDAGKMGATRVAGGLGAAADAAGSVADATNLFGKGAGFAGDAASRLYRIPQVADVADRLAYATTLPGRLVKNIAAKTSGVPATTLEDAYEAGRRSDAARLLVQKTYKDFQSGDRKVDLHGSVNNALDGLEPQIVQRYSTDGEYVPPENKAAFDASLDQVQKFKRDYNSKVQNANGGINNKELINLPENMGNVNMPDGRTLWDHAQDVDPLLPYKVAGNTSSSYLRGGTGIPRLSASSAIPAFLAEQALSQTGAIPIVTRYLGGAGRPADLGIGAAATALAAAQSPRFTVGAANLAGRGVRAAETAGRFMGDIAPTAVNLNNQFQLEERTRPRTLEEAGIVIPPTQGTPGSDNNPRYKGFLDQDQASPEPGNATPPSTATPAPETAPIPVAAPQKNHDRYSGFLPEGDDLESPPQPQNQGGRVAYKKGGKVSPHIEPLVQDLMSRYKHAKKAETATTKPLLQHHDKAIVKALNIAKKAI